MCSIVRIFRSITLSLSECRCVCNTGFTVIVFHRAPPPSAFTSCRYKGRALRRSSYVPHSRTLSSLASFSSTHHHSHAHSVRGYVCVSEGSTHARSGVNIRAFEGSPYERPRLQHTRILGARSRVQHARSLRGYIRASEASTTHTRSRVNMCAFEGSTHTLSLRVRTRVRGFNTHGLGSTCVRSRIQRTHVCGFNTGAF